MYFFSPFHIKLPRLTIYPNLLVEQLIDTFICLAKLLPTLPFLQEMSIHPSSPPLAKSIYPTQIPSISVLPALHRPDLSPSILNSRAPSIHGIVCSAYSEQSTIPTPAFVDEVIHLLNGFSCSSMRSRKSTAFFYLNQSSSLSTSNASANQPINSSF